MEIIEKQIEKVKEVPAENYDGYYGNRGYNRYATRGLAGTASQVKSP